MALTAATPPARMGAISSCSGATLPASTSSRRTTSGEICSNRDVSTCPA
ncbi:Uncharacterised protein [Mycobacteroides abscessus subsp. abscessus]|nr:Uncharacterised protein [Mycobacteroides abscessus subsp. abscessus]